MYTSSETLISSVIAGVRAAAALAAWPWARLRARFAIAGIATLVYWIAWHSVLLQITHATSFDVDAPVIRLS